MWGVERSALYCRGNTNDTILCMEEKKHVLVVEDDIFISDLLGRRLKEHYVVLHADTVEQGKRILGEEAIALVCLDLRLPGENGLELLKYIRATERFKNTKVMIVSNFGEEDEIREGYSLGADEYLVKANLSLDDIVAKADQLLLDGENTSGAQ